MVRLTSLFTDQRVRFAAVGIANTLLNFIVLNTAFYGFKQGKIASGIIATCCAVAISFFLNRNFVFKHTGRSWRLPMLFALVTLSGVMLVQNTVYITFIFLLHGHMQFFVHLAHAAHLKLTDTFFDINVSNLIGSLCAMVWNYNGYRLVVFTKPLPQPEIDHETA